MRRRGRVLVLVAVLCARWCRWPRDAAAAPLSLRGTNWVLRRSSSVNAVFDGARVQGASACNALQRAVHGEWFTPADRSRRRDDQGRLCRCRPRLRGPSREGGVVPHPRDDAHVARPRRSEPPVVPGLDRQVRAARWVERHQLLHRERGPVARAGERALTLEFADARVSGNGGCNTFDGGYRVRGVDRIHIGPLAATLRACADSALNDQETRYLAALQLADAYQRHRELPHALPPRRHHRRHLPARHRA